jgi:glyoxylase-like metal-dependent hydrolase (beta-lactamase superfamily II)
MTLHDHSTAEDQFFQIHLGGDRNFCYLLGDRQTGEGAAVDPGFEPDKMASLANKNGLAIKHILLTHGHGDHVGGLKQLVELTGATVHAGRQEGVAGAELRKDGDRLILGRYEIEILATPGHTRGHLCFLFNGRLITGDLLFCGKVGGTGPFFPGSSASAEWDSLHRLLKLPEATLVFPGHDYYGGEGSMPHSTIGYERENNPFLLCQDFDAFCQLKENWAAFKEEHGIR